MWYSQFFCLFAAQGVLIQSQMKRLDSKAQGEENVEKWKAC